MHLGCNVITLTERQQHPHPAERNDEGEEWLGPVQTVLLKLR